MKRVQLRRLGDNTYRVEKIYETDRPRVGKVIGAISLADLTDAGYLLYFTDANLPSNTGRPGGHNKFFQGEYRG